VSHRILVTYATKAGSTAGVAEVIAQALGATAGAEVDLCAIEDAHDIAGYDGFVVGSCIRVGKWQPAALAFLKTHQAVLAARPVALFTVCWTMREPTPENLTTVQGYVARVLEQAPALQPVASGLFAGVMKTQDRRDWAAIRAWASEITPALLGE
jgi:menaquinone-dependent protoporphyrinogen oxidase